jgi:hypothetical protein
MMQDLIEHTEHRRATDERREPVAWSGPAAAAPAPATEGAQP